MITRQLRTISTKASRLYGSGSSTKPYDFRDDPELNPDLDHNPRLLGWDVSSYETPHRNMLI